MLVELVLTPPLEQGKEVAEKSNSHISHKEKQNSRVNRWPSLIMEWPRFLITGKSDNDRFYDSSKLDSDSTISGVVRIPCVVDHPTKKKAQCLSTKSVRVKSFAPITFRDLRNKCFGVSEKEYAKSILNIVLKHET